MSVVYFVTDGRRVKVGFTTDDNPSRRVRSLQTSAADPLLLIGYVRGGRDLEEALHRYLAPRKCPGGGSEWFDIAPQEAARLLDVLLVQAGLPSSTGRRGKVFDAARWESVPPPTPPAPAHDSQHPNRMMRLPEVCALAGVAQSTVYEWMGKGLFPRPRKLGPRTVAWRAADVEAWLATRST